MTNRKDLNKPGNKPGNKPLEGDQTCARQIAPDPTLYIAPEQTRLNERILVKLSRKENVILTAPPGFGKDSMVKRIAFTLTEKHEEYQVCFLDLISITSRVSFLRLLRKEVLKFANPGECKEFRINSSEHSILSLPEYLAKRKKIKLLICIKNIQNIARFPESKELQKEMRLMRRKQKSSVYFLYGHNRELMISIFRGQHNPLASFGRLYTLDTPILDGLDKGTRAFFFNSGKRITPEAVRLIRSITLYHTFSARLLTSQAWWRTPFICTEQIVRETLESLIFQFQFQYQMLLDQLSIKQVNYLRALLDQAQGFCSKQNLREYQLGRSSNVTRIRNSLIKKEIIYSFHGETFILDPLLRYWLANYYFGKPR